MNERIKAILDNSGIETAQDGAGYEYHRAWPEDMEKFAELIIRECSNVAMDNLDSPASAIETYFGVE